MLLPAAPAPARAAATAAALCTAAIEATERGRGIPRGLLSAIGRVESGRPGPGVGALLPWPWTIDAGGVGHFYATKAEAIAAVRALQASGIRSIDVGCLQVNLAHHPAAFGDLDQAFDPQANALYAAGFLQRLFAQTGNWKLAAAAYHSQTPSLGAEYRQQVMAQWGAEWGRGDKALPGVASPSPYAPWPPPGVAYGAFAPANYAYRALPSAQLPYQTVAAVAGAAAPRAAAARRDLASSDAACCGYDRRSLSAARRTR